MTLRRRIAAGTAASAVVLAAAVAGSASRPPARVIVVSTHPAGTLNPAVTQETLSVTVCVPGWTRTVRPRTSYTSRLKVQQMAERHLSGSPRDYEEDHEVPLAVGGHPTDPANLWPEPWPDAHAKDVIESRVHRDLCAGRISLAEARAVFTTGDWRVYGQ